MKKGSKTSHDKSNPVAMELRRLGIAFEDNNHQIKLVAEMVGHLSKDMAIVKEDIEFIKNGFKKKVDMDEFSALARRVSLLERRR